MGAQAHRYLRISARWLAGIQSGQWAPCADGKVYTVSVHPQPVLKPVSYPQTWRPTPHRSPAVGLPACTTHSLGRQTHEHPANPAVRISLALASVWPSACLQTPPQASTAPAAVQQTSAAAAASAACDDFDMDVPPRGGQQRHGGRRAGLAPRIGLDILKAGGNAVDAVGVALRWPWRCPTQATWAGRLHDGARRQDGKSVALDFREVAPLKASAQHVPGRQGQRHQRQVALHPPRRGRAGHRGGHGACPEEMGHHAAGQGDCTSIALAKGAL